MSRIAKADVNRALQLAANTIVEAGGRGGRTSRAELKAKLATLPTEQKKLVDIFFKFVDNRDFKAGAQVTAKDVSKAVAYAKEHMIAKYDLNNNGLSKAEISKMSLTGKRAVDLAAALKAAAGPTGSKLSSAELISALSVPAQKANYTSESDYLAVPISGEPATSAGVTADNVRAAFGDTLVNFFKGEGTDDPIALQDMAFDIESGAESKKSFDSLAEFDPNDEDSLVESGQAFTDIKKLMTANLTDIRFLRVGPKDEDGKFASDQGLYIHMLVGKTPDGKLAGIMYGSVET